jgi:hypothetical protein
MRPDEWLNEPAWFIPFALDEGGGMVINKREILVLTVAAESCSGDIEDGAEVPTQHVAVEAEAQRLVGTIAIDMPDNQRRILDYLNKTEPFLTLRDGDRHHLVQKERITRIVEIQEA